MTEVHNAFKMPYEQDTPEQFVSFDKKHHKQSSDRKAVEHRLAQVDDGGTESAAELGYD